MLASYYLLSHRGATWRHCCGGARVRCSARGSGGDGQSAGGGGGAPATESSCSVGDEPPRQQAHGTALHTAQVRTGRRLRDPAQALGVPSQHLQGGREQRGW